MALTADGLYRNLKTGYRYPISPGELVDFGIDKGYNDRQLAALISCIAAGATVQDFRDVSCNGTAIKIMVRRFCECQFENLDWSNSGDVLRQDPNHFVIRQSDQENGEMLFWNNDLGWVDLDSAALYMEQEVLDPPWLIRLPMGGVWISLEAARRRVLKSTQLAEYQPTQTETDKKAYMDTMLRPLIGAVIIDVDCVSAGQADYESDQEEDFETGGLDHFEDGLPYLALRLPDGREAILQFWRDSEKNGPGVPDVVYLPPAPK